MAEKGVGRRCAQQSEDRKALLKWAAGVSGLPLQHISELQNGAVFCYIISLICDLDLTLVNYDAEEECECLANFRLLQSTAKARRVPGLNHRAKLAHWGRLAVCEQDAWDFLAILRRCLRRAGKGAACAEIEADATPPPPPLYSRRGKKKRLEAPLTENYSARSRLQKHTTDKGQFSGAPPGERLHKLTEVLLSSTLSDDDVFISTGRLGSLEREADTPRTDRSFERKYSGASTVSAIDPLSPNSSLSDKERSASRLLTVGV